MLLMTWRLLDDTPDRTEWFQYDDAENRGVVKTVYKNANQILEQNKAIQGRDVGITKDDDNPGWVKVARIPNYVIEKLLTEKGIDIFNKDHGPALMRLLDDPEYRFLRVNTQQLGIRKKIA